jgi:antitoxin ParD1/3/4
MGTFALWRKFIIGDVFNLWQVSLHGTWPIGNICHILPYYGRANSREDVMATMNISVPDPMKDWVQDQIDGGKYASSSDYVRDLIRKDQQERDKLAVLQAAISLGFESAPAGKLDIEFIKRKAKRLAGLESK